MKKILLLGVTLMVFSPCVADAANVAIGIGVPGPVYAAPPPIYPAYPAPVYGYPPYGYPYPYGYVYPYPSYYHRHHYYDWGYWHGGERGHRG